MGWIVGVFAGACFLFVLSVVSWIARHQEQLAGQDEPPRKQTEPLTPIPGLEEAIRACHS